MNPEKDGVDHINVYSKGKTEIGRLLSNFAETPFTYEPYGTFKSVEGFWYYYFTDCENEYLKDLHGSAAKTAGKKVLKEAYGDVTEKDKEIVLEAIRCKLRQNRYILDLLVENDLPFEHYYVRIDDNKTKVTDKPEYKWMMDEYERIRGIMIKELVQKSLFNRIK